MAFREGNWENVRGFAGIILSLRRLGTASVGGNAGGFRTGKLEKARTGVDPRMLARIESQKNLAVLYSQRTQIR
jgi:hypothetical protein